MNTTNGDQGPPTGKFLESFNKKALLGQIDGDMALFRELMVAAEDMKDRIESLGVYIQESDSSAVMKCAHKLKGAALSLTFNRLAHLADKMEESAESDKEILLALHRLMSAEWAVLEPVIKAELA